MSESTLAVLRQELASERRRASVRTALADPTRTELVFDLVHVELDHAGAEARVHYFVEDPSFPTTTITFDELAALAR